jgi:hypothetical protein
MTARRNQWRPLLAAGGLLALGCSRAAPAPGVFVKVDDMEGDSSGVIEWVPPPVPGLLPGAWFSATDCTEADQISPRPSYAPGGGWSYDEVIPAQQTLPGVVSTHAAHLSTTPELTNVWGANMGFDLAVPTTDGGRPPPPSPPDAGIPAIGAGCVQVSNRDSKATPVDLTAYSGLMFWARSGGGASHLAVQLADINVDPRGNICNASDPNDESNCYNHFRTLLPLSETWTRYTVAFKDLHQDPTWGYRPVSGMPVLQLVYQITFEIDEASCGLDPNAKCAGGATPLLQFDIWVDDIYFVAKQ